MTSSFLPTRSAGLEQLRSALPRLGEYAHDRGFDRPNLPTTSRLSPYLQRRLVTEEEVVAAVGVVLPWPRAEKFVQEVAWRTYWKGALEHQPAVWARYRDALTALRQTPPAGYAAAVAGQTGIEGFDDWARQLVVTGWLHNHARMWFASIWIFTLRLPWELGADFFLRHLLDGDAASNTLSWRWVAGLHTPGKTYLARAANIATHTDGRFSPRGLATEAVALTEAPLPRPTTPWIESPRAPASGPVGLWIHPEDLCAEQVSLSDPAPTAVFAAWPETLAGAEGWSEEVTAFGQAALADGAGRAAEAFGAPLEVTRGSDLGTAAAIWAQAHGLRTVVALRPAIGPWGDAGRTIERALAGVGVTLAWRQRSWDTRLHPHASRGFFPFWTAAKSVIQPG
jgi:deoxyribodipyrimidine photo-lyase